MPTRQRHIVNLLIRKSEAGGDKFLVYPRKGWSCPDGGDYLTLAAKTTVKDPLAPYIQGTPLDSFVDAILQDDLRLDDNDYVIEKELEAVWKEMTSPVHHELTEYTIYALDVWVEPQKREELRHDVDGEWLTCDEALGRPQIAPTSQAVFEMLKLKGSKLLSRPADRPSMDGLALKWLAHNRIGVRHLTRETLNRILDAGDRAFNLRVADPYLRYQMQGVGFTWSFFTEKDKQDIHVHGAPVIEIYGALEGKLEIWWKAYYDRGTSAWCHRILEQGDWVEVDSLQCHIVHWLGMGKGIVFKAGPGPLIGVGRLGEKGKTPCADCPCMKPPEVLDLARTLSDTGR